MIKISDCFKLFLIGSSLIFYDKLLFYCDKTLQHMLRKPICKKLALFSTFHCLFQRLRKCFKLCKLALICRAYIEIKRFWKFFLIYNAVYAGINKQTHSKVRITGVVCRAEYYTILICISKRCTKKLCIIFM